MEHRWIAIAHKLVQSHPVPNPNGGTDCLVIGASRPGITVAKGESYLLARYILGIEKAGTLVVAMHSCDNPPCVNPEHLSVGNQSQNLIDARRRKKF